MQARDILLLILAFLFTMFFMMTTLRCASKPTAACTWVCANPADIPDSCACAEEIMAPPPCGKSKKGLKVCQPQ